MQFAAKMMLVPFNKEAIENCINMRSDGEKILKNTKLNTTAKLLKYRTLLGQEKQSDEKNKAPKVENQEAKVNTQAQAIYETEGPAAEVTESFVGQESSSVDHQQEKLHQQLLQLQQQNKKLKQEHRVQLQKARAKERVLDELENKVAVGDLEGVPSRKRKVRDIPSERGGYYFTVAPPPPDVQPLIKPQAGPSKKILTPALVHKLDIMPEEADKDPDFPSLGRYDRQFVTPNVRQTRSLLNCKKY